MSQQKNITVLVAIPLVTDLEEGDVSVTIEEHNIDISESNSYGGNDLRSLIGCSLYESIIATINGKRQRLFLDEEGRIADTMSHGDEGVGFVVANPNGRETLIAGNIVVCGDVCDEGDITSAGITKEELASCIESGEVKVAMIPRFA